MDDASLIAAALDVARAVSGLSAARQALARDLVQRGEQEQLRELNVARDRARTKQ